jgi:hypothetical protein
MREKNVLSSYVVWMKQHVLCKEKKFNQYKRQQIARFSEQNRFRRTVNYAKIWDVPVG